MWSMKKLIIISVILAISLPCEAKLDLVDAQCYADRGKIFCKRVGSTDPYRQATFSVNEHDRMLDAALESARYYNPGMSEDELFQEAIKMMSVQTYSTNYVQRFEKIQPNDPRIKEISERPYIESKSKKDTQGAMDILGQPQGINWHDSKQLKEMQQNKTFWKEVRIWLLGS